MAILNKIKELAGFETKEKVNSEAELERAECPDNNTRIIAIASGKGGVGKTNFTVNLGLSLQKNGHQTLIIDADFGMANADLVLGITPIYNLGHIIKGKCTFQEAIVAGPNNMHILPGTSGSEELINMSSIAIKRLLATSDYIENKYDFVLLDIGAGIHNDVLNFIRSADESIIILTPEPTSIMDAYSLIKIMQQKGCSHQIHFVVNQVDSMQEGELVAKKITKAVSQYLKLDIKKIGIIPFDKKLRRAVKIQQPVLLASPHTISSLKILEIADYIIEGKKTNRSRGMKGFIYRMVGLFNQ